MPCLAGSLLSCVQQAAFGKAGEKSSQERLGPEILHWKKLEEVRLRVLKLNQLDLLKDFI